MSEINIDYPHHLQNRTTTNKFKVFISLYQVTVSSVE